MKTSLKIASYITASIWIAYAFNLIVPFFDLNNYGIIPRTASGLIGIVCSPFLHANFFHIVSNTLPLFVLSWVLFYFYKTKAVQFLLLSTLITGILVWLMGRDAIHIGASGLIYSLASFIIYSGILKRKFTELLVSIVIIIFYGGLIWGAFPTKFYVSWESHLAGIVAGILIARYFFKPKKETQDAQI